MFLRMEMKTCYRLVAVRIRKMEMFILQSCPTLRDPMDSSPPGFSVHGIFQARILEFG